jgi:cation transporter-like permease
MSEPSDTGWADRPGVQLLLRIALYVACVGLIVAEFLIHRHAYNRVEAIPLLYAMYGFAALLVAVTIARGLRRLLKRDEDFYD